MDARTFFDSVALMRKYQRDYANHHRKSDLQQAKRYENMIDAEISRVHAICGTPNAFKPQPGLFDRQTQ